MLNPDATQLDKSFRAFIDEHGAGVEHRLLFYFAGHGHTLKQSYGDEMGYIVPVDAPLPRHNPTGFRSKAMDMQQMEVYARRIQSKHALFVFDSCFSGSIFTLPKAVPEIISYKTAFPVRQFITSGSADELVPANSDFRRLFIEGINGEADVNHDNYVTGTELGEFLQERVVRYTNNAQHPQHGKIRNPALDKGDFVFATSAVATTAGSSVAARPKDGTIVRGSSGIELAYVPAGSFLMGSSDGDLERATANQYKVERASISSELSIVELDNIFSSEQPQRPVTIREGFYMGRYEVTQAQWQDVMGTTVRQQRDKVGRTSRLAGEGNSHPIYYVSWDEAQEFIRRLNAKNDGFRYRLPTEAEWEYAARANTTTDFAFGNSLSSAQANFDGSHPYSGAAKGAYLNKTTPVGSFQANRFGLYDMHGNVWEWVQDYYHDDYTRAPADGVAWLNGGGSKMRVNRGGSWYSPAYGLRSAFRNSSSPDRRYTDVGFRVAATAQK